MIEYDDNFFFDVQTKIEKFRRKMNGKDNTFQFNKEVKVEDAWIFSALASDPVAFHIYKRAWFFEKVYGTKGRFIKVKEERRNVANW